MAIENTLLKGAVRDFAKQFQIQDLSEDKQFENFVNFCIAGKFAGFETTTADLLENVNIGNGNDWGIDGFLILVNNQPIESLEEMKAMRQSDWRISIYLTQSKTSSSIDVGELNKFLAGIRDTITYSVVDSQFPPCNESLYKKLEILRYIFENSENISSEPEYKLPRLTALYVHSGTNKGDQNHLSRIKETKEFLDNKRATLGNVISIIPGDDIRDIYIQLKSRIKRSIEVKHYVDLPKVPGIEESYLCLIKFSEFRKLIEEEDGKIMSSIFEDNVRHFQGDNPVNQAIAKTIMDGEINLFTALNNGLTVMGKPAELRAGRLTMRDYQIVNGCQTCHVLHNHRNQEGIDDLILMVKVISSEDSNIRDKIVIANNNQTAVLSEQLTSLHKVHRKIEDYFKLRTDVRLFYERRSKQYQFGNEEIPAGQVITIPYLIKAFVSMILGQPHMTSRYYGQILEMLENKNQIFKTDTNPALYYASALAAYRRDELFRHELLPGKLKFVKHHLLQVLPWIITEKPIPNLNDRHAEAYANLVCSALETREKALEGFTKTAQWIHEAMGRDPYRRDLNDEDLSRHLQECWFLKLSGSQLSPYIDKTVLPTINLNDLSTYSPIYPSNSPSHPGLKGSSSNHYNIKNHKRKRSQKKKR